MSNLSDLPTIDSRRITSMEAVLTELRSLNKHLSGTPFDKFIPFNKACEIVTAAIKDALDNGYFTNPDFIERLNVRFAHYYLQTINDLSAGNPTIVPAWAKIMEDKQRPTFVLLLMGANAHIAYDLPLTLQDIMGQERESELFKDVVKIDKLLMKSGGPILASFDEPNKRLDFLKRRFQFLYFRPVMYMILFWRVMTWRNYKALQRNRIDNDRLARRANKIANRLDWLGARLSSRGR